MNQNYLASALFGALTLGLLAAEALMTRDGFGFGIVVVAAGAAWASCYLGAAYEQTLERQYTTLPGVAMLAMAFLAWAVLFALYAILRVVFGW